MRMSALPPAHYIETDNALRQLVADLKGETLLAVDTESNSLYAYRTRVCLIQLSTRTTDYIIDPLAIEDMQPFGTLLVDPNIEKVFHAAEYDLVVMKRDFDFDLNNLFDTMFAARLLRMPHVGLADLLERYLNVTVDKSHQTDNWGARPLSPDKLQYAQMDTHYLPALRDMLYDRLAQQKRLAEAREVFADVSHVQPKTQHFDPDGFWKIGRPRGLDRREMAVLKELYLLRDDIARAGDVPPFKVMPNTALIQMAQEQPTTLSELAIVDGMAPACIRLHGEDVLKAIERGRQAPTPRPPRQPRLNRKLNDRYVALHAWRKDRAQERNMDSNLVLPKQTLWQLAETMPRTLDDLRQIDGIGEWRLKQYGPDILALIKNLR